MLMDPFEQKFSSLCGDTKNTCNTGTPGHYVRSSVRFGNAHKIDNNLQLVHLLTTNPAAALPAIFPTTGSPQKVYARQGFQMTRPRITNNNWRGGANNHGANNQGALDNERMIANSWTASIMNERVLFRRERSFSELYVSKEEIDKKACCIDMEGNFDFEAILPVVYWKPELEEEI